MIEDFTMSRLPFRDWNDQMFTKWGSDRLYQHPSNLVRLIQKRRIQTIVSWLDVADTDTVLDMGCGEGFLFTRTMAKRCSVGVDLSTRALDVARARNKQAVWVNADVCNLPFADSSFDKICCSEVIEHVLYPDQVLKELRRVVKVNGRIIITIPDETRINQVKDHILTNRVGRWLFPGIPLRTEWHLTNYDAGLLKHQLKGRFEVEREQSLPFAWLRLGHAVLCRPAHPERHV